MNIKQSSAQEQQRNQRKSIQLTVMADASSGRVTQNAICAFQNRYDNTTNDIPVFSILFRDSL